MPKKLDLTGQRFGRLTVLREGKGGRTSGGNAYTTWVVVCDCNPEHEFEVRTSSLKWGHTLSCGCWNDEVIHQSRFKSINTYDLSGKYGIGYTPKGEQFWFDLEDYPLISQYNWRIHHKYVEAHVPMTKPRKQIMMHRLVMGMANVEYDYKIDVDHIRTENKFDNRKANLRIVTKAENTRNHVIQKNSSTGINGVQYDKRDDRWRAFININGKRTSFLCKNKEDAIRKRKELEDIYYGDNSYRKSQELADKLGL